MYDESMTTTPAKVIRTAFIAAAAMATLTLSACASPAATGTAVGSWGNAKATTEPSLEFTQDGEYSGTDGCNRVHGSYTEKPDGTVDLGAMLSTMMACEGVDTWLIQAQTGEIKNDVLTLRDEGGKQIGELKRSGS